jgi:hypothetical protein
MERGGDTGGERRRAPTIEQDEQLVWIHAGVGGELGRQVRLEARRRKTPPAPLTARVISGLQGDPCIWPCPTHMAVRVAGARGSYVMSSAYERQELLAGAGVVAQQPEQRRCRRARARLLHAAQRHAEVLGLDHDADALGPQVLL